MHRVAGVILHQHGKALLQHRDEDPGIRFPGWWAIFGGHVEEGEDPEAAARREILEELGLALDGPLGLIYHADDGDRERFFFAAPLKVPLESLCLTEGQGMALAGPEEWDDYRIVPLHRKILEEWGRQSA